MPKVKISPQEKYSFETSLTIRVSDLNYGAHLGYDRVLALAHQARLELFKKWQVTELDLGDGTTGLVVGDVAVNYLGEGFLNDVLKVEIIPVEVGTISFRLAHRFTNRDTGAQIALLEIGFVGFDYGKRRPGRMPDSFLNRLKGLAGGELP